MTTRSPLARPQGGPRRRLERLDFTARVVLLMALCSTNATNLPAQEPTGLPPVVEALTGEWEGSGILLGNQAAFRMKWTPIRGGFVRLSYMNMWIDQNGDTTPVLSAEATYGVEGAAALGVWLDDRPQRLTLNAIMNDSSIVTEWVAPTETGRTEYVVRSPDEAVVRDFVIVDGVPQLFGEGRYRRARAPGR